MKDLEQQLRSDAKPEKPRCAPHRPRENTFNAQRRQGRVEDKRERQAKHLTKETVQPRRDARKPRVLLTVRGALL